VFSGAKLTETTKKISERLGNFGYAFANVNANPQIDREKKQVAFTILVDPGKRVYVRRINIGGNSRTRDEVIRREMRQLESSWYDASKIKLSRDRVNRLGYFTEVNVDTPEVPGTTDQVDLNMNIVEKPTGAISLGAGFSSSEKLTLTGSIQQANAFGSGNTIGLDVNTSRRYRTIAVSQTNPYFTDDGVSRSYEAFVRTTRPPIVTTSNYRIRTLGGNVRFGVPFSEVDTVFFGAGAEHTQVDVDETSPLLYRKFVSDFGSGNTAQATSFPLTVAWQRDNRDSALVPTTGRYQRANLELSLLGDLRYYRAVYQHQYFKPLSSTMTLALNGEVDYGNALNDRPYPVFKNFYAGGIGSVRGYESSSLSVNGTDRANITGGNARIIMNAELQFPFPGTGADRTLRWFTFVDAGQVFNTTADEKVSVANLRYSAGVGISWVSPIGPLKLSFGKAINAKDADLTQPFQFQLGTGF
jgi:outer membrane protein insertion porin family